VDGETWLWAFEIYPPFRREGRGRVYLRELLDGDFVQTPFLHLYVKAENPARRLYRSVGFREIDNDPTTGDVTMKICLKCYREVLHKHGGREEKQ